MVERDHNCIQNFWLLTLTFVLWNIIMLGNKKLWIMSIFVPVYDHPIYLVMGGKAAERSVMLSFDSDSIAILIWMGLLLSKRLPGCANIS